MMAARRTENLQAQTASKMDHLGTENDDIGEDEDDDKDEDEDGYDECDGYSISNFYKEQNNETKWIKTHIKKKCKGHRYLHPLYAGKLSFSHFGSHRLRSRNPVCTGGKRRSEHDSTDAFGEIQFNNDSNQLAKFIRVDDVTLLPELLDHYIYKWKTPHALISVVGGDKNLRMTKQSSEMFYSGLTKIGEATWNGEGILFITGGTNMTVTKYIGEAFKTKHLLSGTDWTRSATPIIGVVPWNTIQRNDQLICTDGKWPIKYGQIIGQSITDDGEEIHDKCKEVLDSNHTNFLFVDGNDDDDNAATTDFRFKLEKIIRESLDGKFILMVIQGGLDTIKFINEAIQNKKDILLIKGYGGIVDIISSALSRTEMDNKKRKELVQSDIEQDDYLLQYALTEEESIRTAEQIEIILQNKELLTVFDLGCCDQAEDFGMILENIIHGGGNTTKTKQETGEEKMKRAIRSNDTKLVSELLQSGKYTEVPLLS